MNLQSVIQLPETAGMDDQKLWDYGNEMISLSPNNTEYTWKDIGGALVANGIPPADYVEFCKSIDTFNGGPALSKTIGNGVNFNEQLTRQMIQAYMVADPPWLQSILTTMLALGQPTGTRWASWGIAQPKIEDIAAERAKLTNEFAKLKLTTLFNAFMEDPKQTVADFKIAVAAFQG